MEARILTYFSNIFLHKVINQIVISQVHIIHIQNVDCKCFLLALTKKYLMWLIFSILDKDVLENKE